MTELDQESLLKRFEPILKFTQGEQFFPYNVADYVAASNLWVKDPKKPPEEILSEEQLDLETLGSINLGGAKNVHYLQFISPINLGEMAEFRFKELREAVKKREFKPARSRLARVGYLARIVDALFSLLLLLRGRVPGDSMTAAAITFNKMLSEKRSFKYYGRVINQSGWIILQYWYFYPFNDWRSGYYGANDHEADWEMVNVYCYQDSENEVHPAWVGYACHNYSGDDLRRNWQDPELEKVGSHPVVYVGGGSHASYFQRGEYLTELSLPFLKPFRNIFLRIDNLFGQLFKENRTTKRSEVEKPQFFTIPFVDYALGDGLAIGHGCDETWAFPGVIEPPPEWVMNFRGLWGYYAQDPLSGEDAPAGPRYNRDGTVRHAWFDPLGWAGLEKVVPPDVQEDMLAVRKAGLRSEIESIENEILWMQEAHYQRGLDLQAIQDVPHLQAEVRSLSNTLEDERQTLTEKRRRLTIKYAMLESLTNYFGEAVKGKEPSLRSHIRRAHQPQAKKNLRLHGLAEIWAAVSIGIMMMAVVLLIVFSRQFLLVGLSVMLLVMIAIEAGFRRRLAALVRWGAITLALAALLILMIEFFWLFALVFVMIIGFYMIVENLRELFARHGH
jgi:hypothetical protein